ncbi:MAG TPA: hypothetical protein VGO93_30820 [Candidatus Xenobia bacterium]|jgi:hypothetical protein
MDLFPLLVVVLLAFQASHLFPPEGIVRNGPLRAVQLAAVFAALTSFVLMAAGGAQSLRDDPGLLCIWSLGGAAWIGLMLLGAEYGGVSYQDDVVGQRNVAAAAALSGAALGVAFVYGGANIGEGEDTAVNIVSIALGTACWGALWAVVENLTRISLAISEDRDVASGVRLGGFLLAEGLLFGRAMAGRWISAEATLSDVIHWGMPALAIACLVAWLQGRWRPTPSRPCAPVVPAGALPALGMVAVAVACVVHGTDWRSLTS